MLTAGLHMSKKLTPAPGGRPLSTLELTVLGLAWLRGPCTIYAIMKELSLSASSFHKSRAGTAYSVSNRLLDSGFLERYKYNHEEVVISEKGITALQSWLTPPIDQSDISHSADLLRLRFFFLGVVEKEVRLAFIDQSIKGLKEFLHQCEALVTENEEIGDYFGVLATLSTILETKARIEWLSLVREFVVQPIEEGKSWAQTVMNRIEGKGDS